MDGNGLPIRLSPSRVSSLTATPTQKFPREELQMTSGLSPPKGSTRSMGQTQPQPLSRVLDLVPLHVCHISPFDYPARQFLLTDTLPLGQYRKLDVNGPLTCSRILATSLALTASLSSSALPMRPSGKQESLEIRMTSRHLTKKSTSPSRSPQHWSTIRFRWIP